MIFLAAADPREIFGTISPPPELTPFIEKGGQGAGGLSLFFTNLIILLYVIASVIFVFMIVFGALQWVLSGGNKDAVANARNRIIHAIIGIVILAAAFAIIRIVGIFTGFSFYNQREVYYRDNRTGQCIFKQCPSGVDEKKLEGQCTYTPVESVHCPGD